MHRATDAANALGRSAARSLAGLDRPPFECIALLLQGGGALGSYQAGVYEALAEADLHPDWVAGISIGAINSAIIAGNPPAERIAKLRSFWQEITANPLLDWTAAVGDLLDQGRCGTRILQSDECRYGPLPWRRQLFRSAPSACLAAPGRRTRGDELL